uniref:Type IV pilus biogenesis n=1 Tax=Candidatus Kentrum sp. TUN TaxID=2126343 RepID=A0A451A4V0_9GAMM|nr:MAG: Type IV pilus biogenesis [Candidatus Kentron sp. TUN]VFK70173.1 MAG: Type IV pilus biogenesis [Candidatus Kentron sp. TUN]
MLKIRYLRRVLRRIFPTLASILLLGGIGHTIMGKFHDASSTDPVHIEEGEETKAQEESQSSPIIKTTHLAQRIAELHLFGESPKEEPKITPPPSIIVPKTILDLVLHGVIVSPKGGGSFAIIASAKGKQNYYPTGSKLSEGIIINEVKHDHVVLYNNNRIEKLYMWDAPQNESEAREFLPSGMKSRPITNERPRRRRASRDRRPPPPPGYPIQRRNHR